MKATCEKLTGNRVELSVEVDGERVRQVMGQAYRRVAGRVNVPGFRKGKVPRSVLEARLGIQVLYDEVLELLLPQVYKEALEQCRVEPIDQPEIEVVRIEEEEGLVFKARVERLPEIDLGVYKGLPLKDPGSEVTPEAVEASLAELQERHARLESTVEPAADGDLVIADMEVWTDDVPLAGSRMERAGIVLGTGQKVPGLEEGLTGVVAGEERDVAVTFPEDFSRPEVAGKQGVFKVKTHEVKRKRLLPLDDDFARDLGPYETLEELKEEVQKKLAAEAETRRREALRSQVVEGAVDAAQVEVPDRLVDREIQVMIEELSEHLSRHGLKLEEYMEHQKKDQQALEGEFRESARNRVKTRLVLDRIAREENVQAAPEEIQRRVQGYTDYLSHLAKSAGRNPQAMIKSFDKERAEREAKREIVVEKTVALLLEAAELQPLEAAGETGAPVAGTPEDRGDIDEEKQASEETES